MTLKHNEITKTGGVHLSAAYHVNQTNILSERISEFLKTGNHQTVGTYSSSFPVLSKLQQSRYSLSPLFSQRVSGGPLVLWSPPGFVYTGILINYPA